MNNLIIKPYVPILALRNKPIDSYHFNKLYSKDWKIRNNGMIISEIKKSIFDETGIDPTVELEKRTSEHVKARQFFFYFVIKHLKYSQEATGRLLGKDHATVINAIRKVENYYETELKYRELFNRIEKRILN